MAEPTLALTFQDFILRVAEYLGISYYGASGTEAAQVPTDAHDLEMCKRIVNDGWRRFVNSKPDWQWLTPLITLTFDPDGTGPNNIDSDPSRYRMPDGFFGQMLGSWTYDADGPRLRIETTDELRIRSLFAAISTTTGPPYLAAIRPIPEQDLPESQYRSKWEVIFYPRPSIAYNVHTRVRLYPSAMVLLTDRHHAGFQFDEAVMAAVMAEAERQREDSTGTLAQAWLEALTRAVAIDQKSVSRRLGYNGDGSDDRGRLFRPYTGVDTYRSGSGGLYNF